MVSYILIESFEELLQCILLAILNHVDSEEQFVEAGQPMAHFPYSLPETKFILSMLAQYSKA